MKKRILRLEDDCWYVRTDKGELPASEQQKLEDYLIENRMPYKTNEGCLFISGEIERNTIFEVIELFYKDKAEVYPF